MGGGFDKEVIRFDFIREGERRKGDILYISYTLYIRDFKPTPIQIHSYM